MVKGALSTYFNLLKTVLGCGMLAFPVLVNQHGLIRTIVLVIVSAAFSGQGLVLYAAANDAAGCLRTLSQLTRALCPWMVFLVDFCISAKCFAVGVLFLVVIRSVISFLCTYAGLTTRSDALLIGCVAALSPLCFVRFFGKLKVVSAAGLLCICGMVFVSLFSFSEVNLWAKEDAKVVKDLGQFVYGFTCHQNVVACQAEFGLTAAAIAPVAAAVVCCAGGVYLLFGISYASSLGSIQNKDMLDAMQASATLPIALSLGAYGVMLALSLPLQTSPCRQAVFSFLRIDGNRTVPHIVVTSLMLVCMLILALYATDFAKIAGCIGGSFSALICYVFGPVLYLKTKNRKKYLTAASYSTLSFGILAIACFLYNIAEQFSK